MTVPSYHVSLSPNAIWIRRCASCGLDDWSQRFGSPREAARAGIWQNARRCRLCQFHGFDLVALDPMEHRQLRPHYQREPHG